MSVYRLDKEPWSIGDEDFPAGDYETDQLTFLLRYAILAPSSHNTQPWKFTVKDSYIDVFADDTRWLKHTDPHRRELYISLGCAIENLVIAAGRFGLTSDVSYLPEPSRPEYAARITFHPGPETMMSERHPLFDSITERNANHKVYDSRPVPKEHQLMLQACEEEGVYLHLTDDSETKRKADDIVVRGDALLFSDPRYREELAYWIGQGVFGTSWLMSRIAQMAVTYLDVGKSQAKKDSQVLMSSALLGVISTRKDTSLDWLKAGRVFERVWLQGTALGISLQPMSQPVEVEELRKEIAKLLPEPDLIPQQTFRMGYAEPEREHTPRRPLNEVLV